MEQKEKITLRSFAGANPAEQLLTHIFKEIMPKEGYAFRESQLALAQNTERNGLTKEGKNLIMY